MDSDKKLHHLLFLVGGATLLGLLHNILFYDESLGINFFLFVILILVVGWGLYQAFGKNIEKLSYLLVIPIVFFALMVFIRSSLLLTFFNIIGCILLFFVIANSQTEKNLKNFLPLDYLKVFFLPLKFVLPFFSMMYTFFIEIFGLRRIANDNPRAGEIVRGTGMAIVALIVFTLLFSQADSSFSNFVEWVFSFGLNLNEEFLSRVVVFVLISSFFIGAFGYMFKKQNDEKTESKEQSRPLGTLEMKILLGSINVLFIIFISLQLAHLFGGISNIAAEGITYAEYARKGFFELILVAILSYLIIATTEKRIIKKEDSHIQSFKILSTILIIQVVVILTSAFMRLSLYEAAYGFSTIRLYSHALMIWIGIVLILLARHILKSEPGSKFSMQVFVCIILLLVSMNLLNPDAFIAKKNLARYTSTGNIDTDYLATLSDDAIPYTVSLLNDQNQAIRLQFANDLYWSRKNKTPLKEKRWQSFHISKMRAEKILSTHLKFIEMNNTPKAKSLD